jgi:hypothetical protein
MVSITLTGLVYIICVSICICICIVIRYVIIPRDLSLRVCIVCLLKESMV